MISGVIESAGTRTAEGGADPAGPVGVASVMDRRRLPGVSAGNFR